MTQQDSSPSNLLFPTWQRDYEALVNEPDPKRLWKRAHATEEAIFYRLQEVAQHSDSSDHEAEHQAIADALGALRVLKRDKLGFPDWESQ